MTHSFFSLNGKIVSANQPHFISTNRALRYGDGLFEGMRILNGEFIFYEDHMERLFNGMNALEFDVPENFNAGLLYKRITDLLIQNKISGDVIIRIQVYRANAGLYEPVNNEIEFFIETLDSSPGSFKWNETGISIAVFNQWKKEFNPAMNFKTCNSQVYVMASRWKQQFELDDALIVNTKGNIADATSSNIFLWKNEKLITPALSEGCIAGVIRKNLIAFAQNNNIEVEERLVEIGEVAGADELFLTNISKGIRWVQACGNTFYENHKTKNLTDLFYSHICRHEN